MGPRPSAAECELPAGTGEGSVIYGWGANRGTQLGFPPPPAQHVTPTPAGTAGSPFSFPAAPVAVAAGEVHSLALLEDGSVWGWGGNGDGQAGREMGDPVAAWIPRRVGALEGVRRIAAGRFHSLAVTDDGALWGWGARSALEISGMYAEGNTAQPVRVAAPGPVADAAAGDGFSLAAMENGTVWALGSGSWGRLGPGDRRVNHSRVGGLYGIATVAVGRIHAVALRTDGAVLTWGGNWSGQLGLDVRVDEYPRCSPEPCRATPLVVPGLPRIAAIAAGEMHTVAAAEDGGVWEWGLEGVTYGQAGVGVTWPAPRVVATPETIGRVVQVAAGQKFSLALGSDGTVWWWGHHPALHPQFFPVLAEPLDSAVPVALPGAPRAGAMWIAAGSYHGLLISRADGRTCAPAAQPGEP